MLRAGNKQARFFIIIFIENCRPASRPRLLGLGSVGLRTCLGAGDGATTYGGELNTTSVPG